MVKKLEDIPRAQLDEENLVKLTQLHNQVVEDFILTAVNLCNPRNIFIVSDSEEDIAVVRRRAIETDEETPLSMHGHTVHFDGYFDQARDTANTKYLVPEGEHLDQNLNQTERERGLTEVLQILKDSMTDKDMIVRFFSLGPNASEFSIPTMQITDSYYVAHSLDLLYRPAYEQFLELGNDVDFFKVLHSDGRLENGVSIDIEKRRIYIDYKDETVYSVNTQYAGNTVGLKKLAFRLAIRRADKEGWLAEHMFIMAVHGKQGRKTYFSGAYPSACGKTSTSMVQGESIVGDDLAYLKRRGGQVRAVNVERGIFGIIKGVNVEDDPVIFGCLTKPGEVIFSNVLVSDGVPYWLGDGREHPESGWNHAGDWTKGMLGPDGKEVPCSSKNARYTLKMSNLENLDENAESRNGVPLSGIIYGGRDPNTSVPVVESFNWQHGVITLGACLESESTSATLGKEGILKFQPFANIDFISIPLGRYIKNHLDFVEDIRKPPKIFGVDYFLRDDDGEYLNSKQDKRVWLKWMELRVHEEVEALSTPIGLIPKYDDLVKLFREVLNNEYPLDDYHEQFKIRIPEQLAKIQRIEQIFKEKAEEVPELLFSEFEAQKARLIRVMESHGEYVEPEQFTN